MQEVRVIKRGQEVFKGANYGCLCKRLVKWNSTIEYMLLSWAILSNVFFMWDFLLTSDVLKSHKIRKNHPLKLWRYWVTSNFMWKIFSNFVAFSEYSNCNSSLFMISGLVEDDVFWRRWDGLAWHGLREIVWHIWIFNLVYCSLQ